MRHLKIILGVVASLVFTLFLGLAGCDDDHRDRNIHSDRNRRVEHNRNDRDRHDDRGRDSDHDRDDHGGSVTWH